MQPSGSRVPEILNKYGAEILSAWAADLRAAPAAGVGRISSEELAQQTREFLALLAAATRGGSLEVSSPSFDEVRSFLDEVSRSRVAQGFSSAETATFVFSLKRPLFAILGRELGSDAEGLAREVWAATALVDDLGLHTIRSFQRTREDVIHRQQQELLELSTPVVKLWDGVLALPMIGTLDSARTQVVMESLLQRIVDTGSSIAIIDITGVPTVDTLVAQHLLKTITAIRLLGAECIVSGIRPQIAQTIVHLGIDLVGVTTRATLADALSLALRRMGHSVVRS
jgi:rsbT co-antagonist protein RsbR